MSEQRAMNYHKTAVKKRREYLKAHPPDGSMQWWVDLANSEMVSSASHHIRARIVRLVRQITNKCRAPIRKLTKDEARECYEFIKN